MTTTTTRPSALVPLAQIDIPDRGGTMQVVVQDGFLYCGHLAAGGGTSIVDVRDPAHPKLLEGLPGARGAFSPKVQVGDGMLLVNYERRTVEAERCGIGIFDVSDPAKPREISYLPTSGIGIHRLWYDGGRYAYLSGTPEGYRGHILQIADLANPAKPEIVGRWWVPGSWEAGGEARTAPGKLGYYLHHAVVAGDRAYVGCWDYGVVILDITDRTHPRQIAHVGPWSPQLGGNTHTALPLLDRGLLVVTDESIADLGQEAPKYVRVFDIADETKPRELSRFPVPAGDFASRGGRFGPHNLHENRPGSFISDQYIYVSYFNAGIRLYDIANPQAPREVAAYVPEPPPGESTAQVNDLFVDREGVVFASDRNYGRLYIV
ncbi:MAG TPA: hypothetical protein VMA36_06875, partial [Candidatus Limnocylindria bacterium]|nr:hypothetical protein [Candidatus Limnocylindria bacterium]